MSASPFALESAKVLLKVKDVELFRADMVDGLLLKYFRLKKKPVADVSPEIAHFLAEINN